MIEYNDDIDTGMYADNDADYQSNEDHDNVGGTNNTAHDGIDNDESAKADAKQDSDDMADILADEDYPMFNKYKTTTVAPIQHTETITSPTDTNTQVDTQVSSQSVTETPTIIPDPIDVDFSTEEVVNTPSEALRSPVMDVASIAKVIATSSDAEVSVDTPVATKQWTFLNEEEMDKLDAAEIRSYKNWMNNKLSSKQSTANKRAGIKTHTLSQAAANDFIAAVKIDNNNADILMRYGSKHFSVDTRKVILSKTRPKQVAKALKQRGKKCQSLKFLLKNTPITTYDYGRWSKSSLGTAMNLLRAQLVFADTLQDTKDKLKSYSSVVTDKKALQVRQVVETQIGSVSSKADAKVLVLALHDEGMSSTVIAKHLHEAGFIITDRTVRRWIN